MEKKKQRLVRTKTSLTNYLDQEYYRQWGYSVDLDENNSQEK